MPKLRRFGKPNLKRHKEQPVQKYSSRKVNVGFYGLDTTKIEDSYIFFVGAQMRPKLYLFL